ncbi:glycosyltransferase family 2 protein [Schaalia suimastitidis]|uniref:glycosyltransferase family 2 protein n=1 Tax=Schaalia suimastitidis TaxID=121163 RepID=UPI00041E1513|nr:glycosyltransferase family 2 protein [Schaalia suimastitidis]
MPDISVLIPALNARATIGAAITSTFRALPIDSEIIILDDGSTDDTAQRAADAAQQCGRAGNLRILSHQTPQGVATALNEMLNASDSRLVARMDADDITLPGRFRAGLKAIAGGDDFVFSQMIRFGSGLPRPYPPLEITPEALRLELLITNPVCHPTMLATRDALQHRLGGYRTVPAEDYDLWLRAATLDMKLRRLASWGLLYRMHPGQVTASKTWRSQSWASQAQAQAYAAYTEHTVGVPLKRLVAIAAMSGDQRITEMDRFTTHVGPALDAIPGFHGRLVRRRYRQRIAWATHQQPNDSGANN